MTNPEVVITVIGGEDGVDMKERYGGMLHTELIVVVTAHLGSVGGEAEQFSCLSIRQVAVVVTVLARADVDEAVDRLLVFEDGDNDVHSIVDVIGDDDGDDGIIQLRLLLRIVV